LSASDALLIFLDTRNEFEGWLQLKGAEISARGLSLEAIPGLVDAETREPLRVAAIVPGEAVSVHWLEVPAGLAPAQAIAAARLMAADVSVQPVHDMHVAGRARSGGRKRPGSGAGACHHDGGMAGTAPGGGAGPGSGARRAAVAAAAGGRLGPLRSGRHTAVPRAERCVQRRAGIGRTHRRDAKLETLDRAHFETSLSAQIANPAVNLRQGAFAKRRRWKIEWPLIRRMVMLGAAILLVTLAIQIVSILRYTYAADALELEASRVAGQTLRRSAPLGNAPALMEQRLTELRGSGAGYSGVASLLFDAIRATPNAELTAMVFAPDGSLRATVQADSPATLTGLQARMQSTGLSVDAGPLRTGGGRPTAELTVRAQ
jgi:general secretion pathway protein L